MTDAVISGTYSDLKFIKTRSVAQVVVEIAIEQADEFLKLFGAPQPGKEIPVAIARLREVPVAQAVEHNNIVVGDAGSTPAGTAKERRPFRSLPLSQQAGMLCEDARFQTYMGSVLGYIAATPEDCAKSLRLMLRIESRSRLNNDAAAADGWQLLVARYESWKLDQQYADNVR